MCAALIRRGVHGAWPCEQRRASVTFSHFGFLSCCPRYGRATDVGVRQVEQASQRLEIACRSWSLLGPNRVCAVSWRGVVVVVPMMRFWRLQPILFAGE